MDVFTTAAQSQTLERLLTVNDKETAWEQDETLLKEPQVDLVNFGKDELNEAPWNHCESLAKGKMSLESDIRGFKQERRTMMKEAVEFKHKITQLELDGKS